MYFTFNLFYQKKKIEKSAKTINKPIIGIEPRHYFDKFIIAFHAIWQIHLGDTLRCIEQYV